MPSKTMSKYLFLDRDGTIIEDKGYVHKIKDLKFLTGAIAGLKKFRNIGYKFIIVTNQAGIARGLYSLQDAERFNKTLISHLGAKGVKIEKIYLCEHHPDFTGACLCRKPQLGLAKLASKEFSINLSDSIFIGDKDSDIKFGKNCGGATVWIRNKRYSNTIAADLNANDLDHAFELLTNTN